MEAYHFRWYTFLPVLYIFWHRAEVTRWLQKDILVVSFFTVVVSCWLQKDIIIDSITFRKLYQRERRSTVRFITWIYDCVWYIRTLQAAVTGSLSTPLLVPNKGQFCAILCTFACGWVPYFLSAVTIPLAIVTCKFRYRLIWKKCLVPSREHWGV